MTALIVCAGLAALAVQAFVLTGRPPDATLMRGIGPMTLAIVLGAELVVLASIVIIRRGAAASRGTGLLALLAVLAALGGIGILLRHPLTGSPVFVHHPPELLATRALLGISGLALLSQALAGRIRLDRAGTVRSLRAIGGNLVLAIVSIGSTLLVCEAGVRLVKGVPLLSTHNMVVQRADLLQGQSANRFDPTIGWVLEENREHGAPGMFTTGDHGVRMNGIGIQPVPQGAILATGDSFTAGSEVANAESWPALLEQRLDRPVVNAAAGGWASDQIVLRAEALLPVLKPRAVIVSFLADDILRAGFRTYGGGNKAWFTVQGGQLQAHDLPVPRFTGRGSEVGWLRSTLGHSQLVALAMQAANAYDWWLGTGYSPIETDVVAVSCLLLDRLRRQTAASGAELYFVMQYGGLHITDMSDEPSHAKGVMRCVEAMRIPSVNLWEPLRARRAAGLDGFKRLFVMHQNGSVFGHMSAEGNALVADLIAQRLSGLPR